MGWRVRGVSVDGYSHRKKGIACQDAWAHASSERLEVLAVADGAGSRALSDRGSRLAVDLAVRHFHFAQRPDADPASSMRAAFLKVREAFLRTTGEDADEHATTLTVVVLTRDWTGYATVGDGFAVVRAGRENGTPQYHLLPRPGSAGEYSNETVFLTSAAAPRELLVAIVRDPGIDGVLLSTDGLAQAALRRSGDRPNETFVQAMFRSLDQRRDDDIAAYLGSDQLSRLNSDDKTVLRAVRA